jgi:hypothetical protein
VGEKWGFPEEVGYDVALVVSELVTNAVEHVPRVTRGCARGIVIGLEAGRGWLRVEVHDSGEKQPRTPAPDREAEDGRGLLLVAGLAQRWGVEQRRPFGKVVWAELPVPGVVPDSDLPVPPGPDSEDQAVAVGRQVSGEELRWCTETERSV